MGRRFTVKEYHFPIYFQGRLDDKRHREKLNEALSREDRNEVGREFLVVCEEGRTTKIPFLFLREHRFVFDTFSTVFVGYGSVNNPTAEKAVLKGPTRKVGGKSLPGIRECIPEYAGIDSSVFERWVLPGFDEKAGDKMGNRADIPEGCRSGCLDRRQTLLANMERNGKKGSAVIKDIGPSDLRYRPSVSGEDRNIVPVIVLIKDVSSSLSPHQYGLSREAFSTAAAFVKSRYSHARLVYLVHDVEAREADEGEFFALMKCGGTKIAAAYRLLLDIAHRYQGREYMLYGLHISDGNSRLSDAINCRDLLEEVLTIARRFAYFQVENTPSRVGDTLYDVLFPLAGEDFLVERAHTKKVLMGALGRFFSS
ncbi:MAG TPA: DUF444 family protein [Clostridia bacterium]|nr:DUF444 family protein [Clostridia bacterium]